MKVYIASHSPESANEVRNTLVASAHEVVSTWHDREFNRTVDLLPSMRAALAAGNLQEIRSADALILVACPDKVPGGKFVEAGYALGQGKRVVIVGRVENMMLWGCVASETISDAITILESNS